MEFKIITDNGFQPNLTTDEIHKVLKYGNNRKCTINDDGTFIYKFTTYDRGPIDGVETGQIWVKKYATHPTFHEGKLFYDFICSSFETAVRCSEGNAITELWLPLSPTRWRNEIA